MATLPSSGVISLNDFNVAMGGALGYYSGRSISLNDVDVRAVADKPSGAVSLADLSGKHVVRPTNPVSFSPALINQATGSNASDHYTVRFEITDYGYVRCVSLNTSSVVVETHYTGWFTSATVDNFSLMTQFNVSVERSAWNGLGAVSTSFTTEPWGLRGNLIIEVAKSGVALPDASYVFTLTDRFNPANTTSKFIRLAII